MSSSESTDPANPTDSAKPGNPEESAEPGASSPGDIELQIQKWVQNGLTLGHHNQQPVFVHGALPGETVKVRMVKQKSGHSFGIVTSVVNPSSQRISSDCEAFPACGGCSFRHIEYSQEISLKLDLLQEHKYLSESLGNLRSSGKESESPGNLQSSRTDSGNSPAGLKIHTARRNHYRNQVRLHSEESHRGFYSLHTNEVVPLPSHGCLNLSEDLIEKIQQSTALQFRSEDPVVGAMASEAAPDASRTKGGEASEINADAENQKSGLSRTLTLSIPAGPGSLSWRFPDTGFIQANRFLILPWLQAISEMSRLRKPSSVYELFCGTGLIGAMVIKSHNLDAAYYGAEINEPSLKLGKGNFRRNGLKGNFLSADLYRGNAADFLRQRWRRPDPNALLIANPPRAGLKEKLCHWIAGCGFKNFIYSSCNPQTLERDLGILKRSGYEVQDAHWLDFFPGTPHSELLLLLEKG